MATATRFVVEKSRGELHAGIDSYGSVTVYRGEEAITFNLETEFFSELPEGSPEFRLYQAEDSVRLMKHDFAMRLSQDDYSWLFRFLKQYQLGLIARS